MKDARRPRNWLPCCPGVYEMYKITLTPPDGPRVCGWLAWPGGTLAPAFDGLRLQPKTVTPVPYRVSIARSLGCDAATPRNGGMSLGHLFGTSGWKETSGLACVGGRYQSALRGRELEMHLM